MEDAFEPALHIFEEMIAIINHLNINFKIVFVIILTILLCMMGLRYILSMGTPAEKNIKDNFEELLLLIKCFIPFIFIILIWIWALS